MKTIIAGSRTFNDYELLCKVCDQEIITEVISGTAIGADKLGEQYAKEKGIKLTQFAADWNRFGKGAGLIRNEEMAKSADAVIVFWNGKSRGSKHMIYLANKYNLKTRIVNV